MIGKQAFQSEFSHLLTLHIALSKSKELSLGTNSTPPDHLAAVAGKKCFLFLKGYDKNNISASKTI